MYYTAFGKLQLAEGELEDAKKSYLSKNPEVTDEILNERIEKCLKRGEDFRAISKKFQINLKKKATKEEEDEYYRLLTQRSNYEKSCVPRTSMFDGLYRNKQGGKTKRRKNSKKTKRRKNSKKTKRRR
jgi:hypothetical protein